MKRIAFENGEREFAFKFSQKSSSQRCTDMGLENASGVVGAPFDCGNVFQARHYCTTFGNTCCVFIFNAKSAFKDDFRKFFCFVLKFSNVSKTPANDFSQNLAWFGSKVRYVVTTTTALSKHKCNLKNTITTGSNSIFFFVSKFLSAVFSYAKFFQFFILQKHQMFVWFSLSSLLASLLVLFRLLFLFFPQEN